MSNSIVIQTNSTVIEDMKQQYKHSLSPKTPQGGIFMAKVPSCTITAYKSGKVMFQGGRAESTSHIRMVAAIVDDKMRELNAKNPSLDTSRLAVLTAVNVIHDYIKLKEEHEKLKESMTKKGME